MTNLFMLIGLPGSGKSYYAEQLARKYNSEIFSTDNLREEMFDNASHQEDNELVFTELHKRIKECLVLGRNAIYDACNISYKRRIAFLESLSKISCKKIAIVIATPYETCIKRNSNRERSVPEYIIKRMYMHWNTPYYYEGWDDIQIVYADNTENYKGTSEDWMYSVRNFDQENSHHKLSLGNHCLKAAQYVDILTAKYYKINDELRYAAMLHDEGKMFTKSFYDSKGNISSEAHYYHHEYVSAYNSLFYKIPCDHLYVSILIQWHMKPYLAWKQSEKATTRDKKLLGENIFTDINLLHEADVYSH